MTAPISIRPLASGDLAQVLQIQAACYTEIVPESEGSLRAKREASPCTCFGAWRGATLVGYLFTVPVIWPAVPVLDAPACKVEPLADTLYVHDLALAAQGRGTGAGQALVRSALAQARVLGLRHAGLVAIQGSRGYWERLGFAAQQPVPVGTAAKLASYGSGAVLMRRSVA